MYVLTCAPREDSDQPAISHSLIRIYSRRIMESQGCKDFLFFFNADNKDPDQTVQMRRLIWVFVDCTCQKVCFLTFLLNCLFFVLPYISRFIIFNDIVKRYILSLTRLQFIKLQLYFAISVMFSSQVSLPLGVFGWQCSLIVVLSGYLVHITKTSRLKYIENFISKNWTFSDKKNSDIFHISAQNIDCGYSLEPPRRGGSNEYPQSMFLNRNKKNNVYPVNPSFTIYWSGV